MRSSTAGMALNNFQYLRCVYWSADVMRTQLIIRSVNSYLPKLEAKLTQDSKSETPMKFVHFFYSVCRLKQYALWINFQITYRMSYFILPNLRIIFFSAFLTNKFLRLIIFIWLIWSRNYSFLRLLESMY